MEAQGGLATCSGSHHYYTARAEFLRLTRPGHLSRGRQPALNSWRPVFPAATTTNAGRPGFDDFSFKLHGNSAKQAFVVIAVLQKRKRRLRDVGTWPSLRSQFKAGAGFEPNAARLQNPRSCLLSSVPSWAQPGTVEMRGKGESGVSWFHNPLRFHLVHWRARFGQD